ncbi:MAG: helix-turn-helix transcriptional regulator [Magnetococcales bacterium]|nr:helix-turn-helix transcriptional regulator [Magnetococcales bacterium]
MTLEPTSEYGRRLRDIRKSLNVSQEAFANMLYFKRTYVTEIETGHKKPSIEFLEKAKSIMNISSDWILYGHGTIFINNSRGEIWTRLKIIIESCGCDLNLWMKSIPMNPLEFICNRAEYTAINTQTQTRVLHMEGMREEWLLHGHGPPFVHDRPRRDVEIMNKIRSQLDKRPNTALLLATDGARCCVILEHDPDDHKPRMEVFWGEVGEKTFALLRMASEQHRLKVTQLAPANLSRLMQGEMGRREFLGFETCQGLAARSIEIECADQLDAYLPKAPLTHGVAFPETTETPATTEEQRHRILNWLTVWLQEAQEREVHALEFLLGHFFTYGTKPE